MRILFASGKGGAGKTTVTAGIAAFWPNPAVLADADVEAPDLGLYLPHAFAEETPVGLEVPVRVTDACDLCGECTSICQFNAIKKLGGRIMPFSDMCHGCGGCTAVCAPHLPRGPLARGRGDDASPHQGTSAQGLGLRRA